jgi:hypothetical protein
MFTPAGSSQIHHDIYRRPSLNALASFPDELGRLGEDASEGPTLKHNWDQSRQSQGDTVVAQSNVAECCWADTPLA